jgi:hypothetical protein
LTRCIWKCRASTISWMGIPQTPVDSMSTVSMRQAASQMIKPLAKAAQIGPLDPFHFGLGALATWARDAGKPGSGDANQFGLYLQKNTTTASFAAAGAEINVSGLSASALTVLSFDILGFPG